MLTFKTGDGHRFTNKTQSLGSVWNEEYFLPIPGPKYVFLRLSVQSHALIDTHCDEPWQCSIHSPVVLEQVGKNVIASDQCKLRSSLMENTPVHFMRSLPFSWS